MSWPYSKTNHNTKVTTGKYILHVLESRGMNLFLIILLLELIMIAKDLNVYTCLYSCLQFVYHIHA